MQVEITGQQIEVTESLREYVNTKFAKLERRIEQINNVRVVLNVERLTQTAEARIQLNGREAYAKSQHTDMYAAIDSLIDKLNRQVVKHKEKLIKH